METNAPGKTLLKVTGILLIIGGAASILLSILALGVGGVTGAAMTQPAAVATVGSDAEMVTGAAIVMVLLGIAGLIGGTFNLIAGILGVKNANKPEKAKICFIFGVIMLSVQVINAILQFAIGNVVISTILGILFGLIVPVLYLMGAVKNKAVAGSTVS